LINAILRHPGGQRCEFLLCALPAGAKRIGEHRLEAKPSPVAGFDPAAFASSAIAELRWVRSVV